jgi:glycosyltransferase involved in cell wall biosynthesis
MKNPSISICIPAFNRPEMLVVAVKSVRQQSYDDWELVVIHDGLNTAVREAIAAISDDRIRFFENENPLGVPGNWNRCIQEARGEFVQILPDDDALCRRFLETAVAGFQRYPEIGFVQTGGYNCDEKLKPALSFTVLGPEFCKSGPDALEWQFETFRCMPACIIFRREALIKSGLWRCDYHDDWATIFKIAYKRGFCYIPRDLCGIRAHHENYAKRLGREGRDGIGDMLNQVQDIFGNCLPTSTRLLRLQQKCFADLGNRSAKASLKALATASYGKAGYESRRALVLNPWAYLGCGIFSAWRKTVVSRRLARILRSGRRLVDRTIIDLD